MMKYALLAGAMTVAAPVLAQTAANQAQAQPGRAPLAQTAPTTATAPTTTAPAETAPADPAATTPGPAQSADAVPVAPQQQPAPATAEAAAPAAPAAQPAPQQAATTPTGGNQVASVVDQEFPSYDKDGDGNLSKAEFGNWMVALKKASDPKASAEAPDTKKWVAAAFGQADKDKSRSVSKTELTGFLSQGQS